MNEQLTRRTWTGAPPQKLHAHPYNRVRACFALNELEPDEWPVEWTASPSEGADEPEYFVEMVRRMDAKAALVSPADATLRDEIEQRWSEIKESVEERLERLVNQRVDAVLAERARAKRDAANKVENLLQKLRGKKPQASSPPVTLEEAWAMVDLSAMREEEGE